MSNVDKVRRAGHGSVQTPAIGMALNSLVATLPRLRCVTHNLLSMRYL